MSEPERQTEQPNQFPRIPKEILTKVDRKINSSTEEENAELWQKMFDEEPYLDTFIAEVAVLFLSEEFQSGFQLLRSVFFYLKDEGFEFPPISKENAKTWLSELRQASGIYSDLKEKVDTSPARSKREIFEQAKKITDFNFPRPRDYEIENPDLMRWISQMSLFQAMGATYYYDLKRRQFHADRLTKQLGDISTN